MADPDGVTWYKSSYSRDASTCVEIAHLDGGHVGVRDSKNLTGESLIFGPEEWDAFTTGVANGKFNCP
ncbi:DUF397 domain-containing protein [Nocardia sp. NPDC004068]|uniref:DUF397 domain-containing protein n=1 Tax=Nocardia sp. NPDC004068 TaxID=3364303 RepID=UPI0036C41EAB